MGIALRDYQREAIEAAWNQLKTPGGGNPLIVLPTGSGKSIVIASMAMDAVHQYGGRVVILQHRKELIEQNADKVRKLCDLPIGLYSAGLNRKQVNEDIIVAGIQSIYKNATAIGRRHLVIIDEVHLLPDEGEGMYRQFLESLSGLNPNLKIVGLTATPYRTDIGKLWGKDSIFQKVTYEAGIQSLIAESFLCPVTSDSSKVDYDTSGLHMRAGEFRTDEMSNLFSDDAKTKRALSEIVARSQCRNSILIFCVSVEHAKHVTEEIEKQTGERCGCVVGETMALERSAVLAQFKYGSLRWLTNCNVLTTGFDAPCIDMIAILRATASPGLFAQICGRGLRTDPTKTNCLILDFGQNVKRHGPIDAIEFNTKAASTREQDAPEKVCPGCREPVHAAMRVCTCGFVFPKPELSHDETPDNAAILSTPILFEVESQYAAIHHKKSDPDAPPTLRMDYRVKVADEEGNMVDDEVISEWICLEHPVGFALSKAIDWWKARSITDVPLSIDEAVELFNQGLVAQSKSITARRDGRWWRILKHELYEVPTEVCFVEDEYEVPF